MLKKAIYTVYLGGYDQEPKPHAFRDWDNVIITDRPVSKRGWQKIINVDPTDKPDIESRRYKWLSHIYLSEYQLVCYYDGNIRLRKEPPSYPFRLRHNKRTNIYDEVEACKLLYKAPAESLNAEYEYFIKDGFKDDQGLFLNGFFCRNHGPQENELCEMVFDIVQRFTPRDQVALPYVIWKTGYQLPEILDKSVYMRMLNRINHKITKPKIHGLPVESKGIEEINVHHITPGRSDKNFGKAINDIVKSLPDRDWICLRDIDTLPMYHEVFFEQCETIARSGNFDLVGCMTNRLGLDYQLYNRVKSCESDILKHRDIAVELYEQYGTYVEPTKKTIGGLFMLFSKQAWLKAGGFPEGGIYIKNAFIDYHFCKRFLTKNMKIGIAKGIYLFHYYRLHHGNETKSKVSKQHLMV